MKQREKSKKMKSKDLVSIINHYKSIFQIHEPIEPSATTGPQEVLFKIAISKDLAKLKPFYHMENSIL